jgi:hypothetical protein
MSLGHRSDFSDLSESKLGYNLVRIGQKIRHFGKNFDHCIYVEIEVGVAQSV